MRRRQPPYRGKKGSGGLFTDLVVSVNVKRTLLMTSVFVVAGAIAQSSLFQRRGPASPATCEDFGMSDWMDNTTQYLLNLPSNMSSFAVVMSPSEYDEASGHHSDQLPHLKQMPRVRWRKGMPLPDIYQEHRARAFVVEGALDEHRFISEGRDIAWIGNTCKGGISNTYQYAFDPSKGNDGIWAGHDNEDYMDTGKFVRDYVLGEKAKRSTPMYAHPYAGVHVWCPPLVDYLARPAFLGENFCSGAWHRGMGQPEVFLGPKGTGSQMHMDNFLTPFWMLLYDGVKRFRVIHLDEYAGPHLDHLLLQMRLFAGVYVRKVIIPHWIGGEGVGTKCAKMMHHVFDPFKPNLKIFPEFAHVKIFEGTLRRGDSIYLPSGTLHAVVNDEASFGISSNEIFPQALDEFMDACYYHDVGFSCDAMVKKLVEKEINKNYDYRDTATAANLRNLKSKKGNMDPSEYAAIKGKFLDDLEKEVECFRGNAWKYKPGSAYEFLDQGFDELLGFDSLKGVCDYFSGPYYSQLRGYFKSRIDRVVAPRIEKAMLADYRRRTWGDFFMGKARPTPPASLEELTRHQKDDVFNRMARIKTEMVSDHANGFYDLCDKALGRRKGG